jgi:hypothetical protein
MIEWSARRKTRPQNKEAVTNPKHGVQCRTGGNNESNSSIRTQRKTEGHCNAR